MRKMNQDFAIWTLNRFNNGVNSNMKSCVMSYCESFESVLEPTPLTSSQVNTPCVTLHCEWCVQGSLFIKMSQFERAEQTGAAHLTEAWIFLPTSQDFCDIFPEKTCIKPEKWFRSLDEIDAAGQVVLNQFTEINDSQIDTFLRFLF